MTNITKKEAESIAGGLFLMSFFTTMWIGIVEYNLRGKDLWLIGLLFSIFITIFGFHYFKFKSIAKRAIVQPEGIDLFEEKRKSKWFMIIFGLEGLAIFIVLNVLANIHQSNYFISSFAFIVGLHFFPLGILFHRKFDFVMGAWTCCIALVGMIMTSRADVPFYIIITFVGLGCAIATTIYGIKMIWSGQKLYKKSLSRNALK